MNMEYNWENIPTKFRSFLSQFIIRFFPFIRGKISVSYSMYVILGPYTIVLLNQYIQYSLVTRARSSVAGKADATRAQIYAGLGNHCHKRFQVIWTILLNQYIIYTCCARAKSIPGKDATWERYTIHRVCPVGCRGARSVSTNLCILRKHARGAQSLVKRYNTVHHECFINQ